MGRETFGNDRDRFIPEDVPEPVDVPVPFAEDPGGAPPEPEEGPVDPEPVVVTMGTIVFTDDMNIQVTRVRMIKETTTLFFVTADQQYTQRRTVLKSIFLLIRG